MPEATSLPQPELLIHAHWIAQVHNRTLLEDHAVAIRDGRITDILPSPLARERYSPQETIELGEHLLIPGLINLHTHAAMSLMRGIADDLPLMTWLQQHIWPAEAAHVSAEFVREGTRLACAEMLKGGTTCFNDMYFFPSEAAEAAQEMGMRAMLGMIAIDFPCNYASDIEDYLGKGLATRDHWRDNPLINFCLAPHAPYTVSDTSFERIQTLAAQLEIPLHLHIHETREELASHQAQYGCSPLERLEKLGLLSPQLIGVHAVHVNDSDMARLARHGCHIAHCPTSNLKLASGIAPINAMQKQGINIGLGTDGAASNNRLDMFQEMRLASLLAKGVSGDAESIPAWEALRMATLHGATALGMEQEIGSIETGKLADLCAIHMDALELTPCFAPISHLLFCAGREQVSHVWIQGKCCVSNKCLVNIDEASLKNSARLWQNRIRSSLKIVP